MQNYLGLFTEKNGLLWLRLFHKTKANLTPEFVEFILKSKNGHLMSNRLKLMDKNKRPLRQSSQNLLSLF